MSRFQRIGTFTVVIFFAFVFAGETFAGVRGTIRRGAHRRTVADHVVAYAALEALPGETGWGRFVVRDDLLPSGDERTVEVTLFGLEPRAKYTVEADGVEVSLIETDGRGDASVKLKTRGRYSDEVPNDLPAANEVLRASVFGTWGGMVLDGAFTVIREHINDPTVHREKINLEHEDGVDAKGMAVVCRKESGAQGFATMASDLEPGLSYSIMVDTTVVGIVTADEEGQAGLELHVPSDENPLPEALQPVDNIRNVRWYQGELLILSGVFTGESDIGDRCHEFEGSFARLSDTGFVLRKGDTEVEIVVTNETEFEGFADLSQLVEGDRLEVEACWDGEVLVAAWIKLLEDDDCVELRGVVVERTDRGFVLQVGDDMVEVVVTEETRFKAFESLDELDGGEVVALEGCFDGEVLVAAWIKLLEDDDCVELRGVVGERTERGFVLHVGDDLVEVVVTEETTFKEFDSLDQLDGGEVVVLEGCFDDGLLVAAWIKLLEDDGEPEMWVADGIVVDLLEYGFAFEADGEVVIVKITEETVLDGYENADQIADGDVVLVEGWWEGEKVYAARVVKPE